MTTEITLIDLASRIVADTIKDVTFPQPASQSLTDPAVVARFQFRLSCIQATYLEIIQVLYTQPGTAAFTPPPAGADDATIQSWINTIATAAGAGGKLSGLSNLLSVLQGLAGNLPKPTPTKPASPVSPTIPVAPVPAPVATPISLPTLVPAPTSATTGS